MGKGASPALSFQKIIVAGLAVYGARASGNRGVLKGSLARALDTVFELGMR
jgi:hypothetical protein